jgi:hypothetical protein
MKISLEKILGKAAEKKETPKVVEEPKDNARQGYVISNAVPITSSQFYLPPPQQYNQLPVQQAAVSSPAGRIIGAGSIPVKQFADACIQIRCSDGRLEQYQLYGIPQGKNLWIEWVVKEP